MTAATDLLAVTALPAALDADLMSARLAETLGDGDHGEDLRVRRATVVATSPGKRAVVAYETATPSGPGPTLIGKVYADRGRGGWVHGVLGELWVRAAAGCRCQVPQPVAYLADLGMSLYRAAPGDPLDRVGNGARLDAVGAAATWLADLHWVSSLRLDRSVDVGNELANAAVWAEAVAAAQLAAAPAANRLRRLVEARAHELSTEVSVPIHKDFQYQHTLFDAPAMAVIDLDEVRMGDPAFDVAHFCAYLRLLVRRQDGLEPSPSGLDVAFGDVYAAASPEGIPAGRRDVYFGYTCLKIAKQLVTGRGPVPVPQGAERDRQLDFILGEGLACLDR